MRSLAQLAPLFLCLVGGAVLGAVSSAYPLVAAHEPLAQSLPVIERAAMLGCVYGCMVGVVATVIVLRRNRPR